MADILKFGIPSKKEKPELTFADRTRLLAEEILKVADAIEAGQSGYTECIVVFSDGESYDLMYDSNLDDDYRIAGILLRAANHAADGGE